MGGCASKPKELDGTTAAAPVENSVPEPEVNEKHVDGVAAQEEVKVETTTGSECESKSKEAPLVDLSSPRPEAEKAPVVLELAPEVHELKVDEPAKVEAIVAEDAPAEAKVAPVAEEKEKEKVVAEKVEEAKEPAVVADGETEKVSA